jgi:outer membrane protein OmpA-like peptidoglycan-associated protein
MRWLGVVILALGLAGCAQRQALFVVLPNPDGSAGEITIEEGKQSIPLNKPYAAGEVRGGEAQPVAVDPPQVQQIFGPAIKARPILPAHFRLYFISDSDELTPESKVQYQDVFQDIKRRPVYQVEVVGHTDTLGDKTYNQALSLRRAETIESRLVQDGLAGASISVAGRGELDLAVKTGDEVSEGRNRRVEITVR